MNSKIKNIIIGVVVVLAVAFLIYIFFIKKAPVDASLTSTPGTSVLPDNSTNVAPDISNDFISVLLSVKSIKLDDSILHNPAFISLKDSSITLVQDSGTEGRLNPFAPIGSESMVNNSNSSGLSTDINAPLVDTGVASTISSIPDISKTNSSGINTSTKKEGSKKN